MKKDYHFFVGRRFAVGEQIFVVRELAADAEQVWVEAHPADSSGEHEISHSRTFSLVDVINWLLVDEEIELRHPNYLAAR